MLLRGGGIAGVSLNVGAGVTESPYLPGARLRSANTASGGSSQGWAAGLRLGLRGLSQGAAQRGRPETSGLVGGPLPSSPSRAGCGRGRDVLPPRDSTGYGHLSSGLLLRVTSPFIQSPATRRRSLCTEKYSPVSTAHRSPIARQKASWGHGGKSGEMDAGPEGRGEA